MQADSAHRTFWETSEVVFGLPFLMAILLQWAFPLSLPGGAFRVIAIMVGVVLAAIGIALIVLARRELRKHGQPAEPGVATTGIVTTGVYAYSRNPLYLGVAGMVLGAALALDLPWAMVTLVAGLAACQVVLILPEERYLEAKFGEEYRRYCLSAHRWLGRKSKKE